MMTDQFEDINPTGPEIIPGKIKINLDLESVKMENEVKLNLYGIDETFDVVDAACSLANAVDASLKDDGKFTIGDLPKFLGPAMKLPKAIGGIDKVPAELNDLTEDEKLSILDIVKAKLELEDNVEAIIVHAIQIVYDIKLLADLISKSKKDF